MRRAQEFRCEICGNASYWGRRAFERHFKEWRHQNGMRALGIPNTKNFFEVTQMKDALELWASIKVRRAPSACMHANAAGALNRAYWLTCLHLLTRHAWLASSDASLMCQDGCQVSTLKPWSCMLCAAGARGGRLQGGGGGGV
jgi:hypothetical protein